MSKGRRVGRYVAKIFRRIGHYHKIGQGDEVIVREFYHFGDTQWDFRKKEQDYYKKHEAIFVSGKPHSVEKREWTPYRQIASEERYDNNKLHGLSQYWYAFLDPPQLQSQVNYVNGKRSGLEKYWDAYGNPEEIEVGRKALKALKEVSSLKMDRIAKEKWR